ncbi:MAG: amidophosphoribosyltransferase [Candidatus Delongbacteria bacterium]|jgi:amidophosphoribosyltransferase|nr:amidophosphoribosyltransferase [Candidatus Delongbacteria bacterium]
MCGVVGVFNSEVAAFDTMLGLFAIQNRGQESCGLAVTNGNQIKLTRGIGLVKDNFTEKKLMNYPGKIAVGHVRYPTRGTSDINNSQPHVIETLEGTIFALASNGDITNYKTLTEELQKKKVNFNSGNDGELILRFIVWNHIVKGNLVVDSIKMVMERFKGVFSTVLMGRDEMWGFRDPYGVRPFSFGKTETGYAFSSESKGLDILRATDIEEVKPGEIIHIYGDNQIERFQLDVEELRVGRKGCAHCVFEPVYFSMPDSNQYGLSVYEARKAMGKALADRDKDLEIDVVVAVPDSSNVQALGYAQAKNVPFEMALIRNHYVGRTFIKPDQRGRDESVKQKFNPVVSRLKGKRIVLVDDSIVRGTTMRKIVGMLKNAGVKEIHLRIASPPVKFPCFYGLDTNKNDLLANKMNPDEMVDFFRVDSLKYMKQDNLSKCVNNDGDNFCFACFDGNYPIELVDVSI